VKSESDNRERLYTYNSNALRQCAVKKELMRQLLVGGTDVHGWSIMDKMWKAEGSVMSRGGA
jgi:hypothetical protein